MKIKYLYKILPIAFICVGLSACLKDDKVELDFDKGPAIMEIPVKNATASLDISSTPIEYTVDIHYSADKPAPNDLQVTVAIDQATLDAYNTAKGTTLELLPAENYTLTKTVTIPAGQRSVPLVFKFRSDMISLTKAYAIPLKITDASGVVISGNYGTHVLGVAIKNKYDGVYTVNGSVVRGGDPVLSGAFPEQEYSLITASANAVDMNRVAVWASGGGIGGIGPWRLTINPSTNQVTVTDALNAVVQNNPAGPNTYDPATKTLKISAFWGLGPLHRAWKATFVFKKPR